MAENEYLDLGNRHWRLTRAAVADPGRSQSDLLKCAAEDFDRDARQLINALRRGDHLLILLRQCAASFSEQQAVIANYKNKNLLRTVLLAQKEAVSSAPADIAKAASDILVRRIIDQISLQRSKLEGFRSAEARSELRAALLAEFAPSQRAIEAALEASLGGQQVKRFKSKPFVRAPKMDAKSLSLMPLVSKSKAPPHVQR